MWAILARLIIAHRRNAAGRGTPVRAQDYPNITQRCAEKGCTEAIYLQIMAYMYLLACLQQPIVLSTEHRSWEVAPHLTVQGPGPREHLCVKA